MVLLMRGRECSRMGDGLSTSERAGAWCRNPSSRRRCQPTRSSELETRSQIVQPVIAAIPNGANLDRGHRAVTLLDLARRVAGLLRADRGVLDDGRDLPAILVAQPVEQQLLAQPVVGLRDRERELAVDLERLDRDVGNLRHQAVDRAQHVRRQHADPEGAPEDVEHLGVLARAGALDAVRQPVRPAAQVRRIGRQCGHGLVAVEDGAPVGAGALARRLDQLQLGVLLDGPAVAVGAAPLSPCRALVLGERSTGRRAVR
jgi:hypothetical protein